MSIIETILVDGQNVPKPDLRDYMEAREVANAKDEGAVADGAADDITAVQDVVDSVDIGTVKGGAIEFHGTPDTVYAISNSITLPERPDATDNHTRWYGLRGEGRGAPRIKALTGMAGKAIIDAEGTSSAVLSYYREVKDIYLAGNGIARFGVNLKNNQHCKVENVFINGLNDVNGSTFAAGVRAENVICAQFRDLKVHNSDGHGLAVIDGSAAFFNANLISGCSMLDLGFNGIEMSGGITGSTIIGYTGEFCHRGASFSGFSGGGNFMAGSYLEANEDCDVYFGADTQQKDFGLYNVYLNGYSAGIGLTNYAPVKVKFADGLQLVGNHVAQNTRSPIGYYFLDANIAGGSVVDMLVAHNSVRDLDSTTPPAHVYNLPQNWVDNRNIVVDEVFAPFIANNTLRRRLPYGGWTLTLAGGSTIAKSDVGLYGSYAVRMIRGTDACQFSMVVAIGPEFKNRWCVLAIPARARIVSKAFSVTATPNGTGPYPGTLSESGLAVGAQRIIYALCFVPADATQITVVGSVDSNSGDFDVGHPCLYVGARPWYDSGGADDDWYHTAAPTTGTWADGDKVRNSAPASGATPAWVCTTPGAAGVFAFSAEANLA